jgi:DNA-binding response OmpR family regulator
MAIPPLILIVDDEPHIVHVLSVKLEKAGFRVACAMDGHTALQDSLNETPDLIITDFQMPLPNGRDLCHALLRNESTRHTPVIMLTARSHSINTDETQPANIKAVIGKPFSPREVLGIVYELLGINPASEIAKAS